MKTAGSLSDRSKAELANLARQRGIRGWANMDKNALVKALSKLVAAKPAKAAAKTTRPATTAKSSAKPQRKPAPPAAAAATKPSRTKSPAKSKAAATEPAAVPTTSKPAATATNGAAKVTPAATAAATATKPVIKPLIPPREATKETPPPRSATPVGKDRLLLAVSNPYWLNAYWEISAHSLQRAEAALKQDWHGARLVLRLFDVTSVDTTSTSETPVKDIVIPGPGNNWYIDVPQPPRTYRADLGYLSRRGEFYVLARSNVVTPPKAGAVESGEILEAAWDDDDAKWKAERMLAMSSGFESTGNPELREFLEERTGRSLGPPKETAFGTGAMPPSSVKKFFFEINAKLIVYGRTDPSAHLTINNDPIKLNPDGTFRMLFDLPDSRQIIPAVAASADGVEERIIVLAIERNTKYLDPMIHDQMNEI
ncbi:MAG: DUF4912 domain-containing protein [Gemmataceae bacterium]|nr:DUF4912 domain-containing protein [Gemmata sp.]MDW8198974.1 DUF4912 domain-containing protein [Gemmataceae bacterium]